MIDGQLSVIMHCGVQSIVRALAELLEVVEKALPASEVGTHTVTHCRC